MMKMVWLHGIGHIVDDNIMTLKNCAKVLGHSNPPNHFDISMSIPRSLPNVPTYTSSIMDLPLHKMLMLHMLVVGGI